MGWLQNMITSASDKALVKCFEGSYLFNIHHDALRTALLAGANPDAKLAWSNAGVGGVWRVPALIATTLTNDHLMVLSPVLDEVAADLLLSAGANPHQTWHGRRHGLGWSFAQWVYETGCRPGWDLLKKHRVDMYSVLSFKCYVAGQMPAPDANRDSVRAEIEARCRSEVEAVKLTRETSPVAQATRPRSPRL